jgi:hypothetical protein
MTNHGSPLDEELSRALHELAEADSRAYRYILFRAWLLKVGHRMNRNPRIIAIEATFLSGLIFPFILLFEAFDKK